MSAEPPQLPLRKLSPAATPPAAPMPPPKLSIAHLMLWMLGTGVVLALCRAQISSYSLSAWQFAEGASRDRLETFYRVTAIVMAPFAGVGVALLFDLVWRLYRRRPLPLSQPGHWILLTSGVGSIVESAAYLVQLGLQPLVGMNEQVLAWSYYVTTLPAYLATAATYFVAWRLTPEPPRWRFYFATNSAIYAYSLVASILMVGAMMLEEAAMLIMFPLMIVGVPIYFVWLISFPLAVVRDFWLKEYRDWLHWAGVALIIVGVLVVLANYVALNLVFFD